MTGVQLEAAAPTARRPRLWHDGVASYAGLAAGVARGPARTKTLGQALKIARSPKVGAAFAWSDPLPGVVFGLGHLRHPRFFLRQFFVDVACPATRETSDNAQPSRELPRSA